MHSSGSNDNSQLGRDTKDCSLLKIIEDLSDIKRIECGDNHSTYINSSENLFVFGFSSKGQLGLSGTERLKINFNQSGFLKDMKIFG